MRNQLPTIRVMAELWDLGLTEYIDLFVYKLLAARKKFNQQITIDRAQTHKRVKKLCQNQPVERTIERAFQRLAKVGLIEIVYKLGFGKLVVKVKSLNELVGQDSEAEPKVSNPEIPEPSNSKKNLKTGIKQQQLIEIKQICKDAGINYRLDKDWWEIASHGLEKVKATIEHMLTQTLNSRTVIRNPRGWFRSALRDNYYLDKLTDNEISISQLETAYFYYQEKLLDLVGCLPKKNGASDDIIPTPT